MVPRGYELNRRRTEMPVTVVFLKTDYMAYSRCTGLAPEQIQAMRLAQ